MSSTSTITVWPTTQATAFIDRSEWSIADLTQFLSSLANGIPEADRGSATVVIPAGSMRLVYQHAMSSEEAARARANLLRQALLTVLQHEVDGQVTAKADDLRALLAQADGLA